MGKTKINRWIPTYSYLMNDCVLQLSGISRHLCSSVFNQDANIYISLFFKERKTWTIFMPLMEHLLHIFSHQIHLEKIATMLLPCRLLVVGTVEGFWILPDMSLWNWDELMIYELASTVEWVFTCTRYCRYQLIPSA